MSNKIIVLKPFLKEVIWANDNLKNEYKLSNNIGEAWLISAIENYESMVLNSNINLRNFFEKNRSFFNDYKGDFPNLSKIIDAKDALSIQVHPNDGEAKEFKSLGKDECWYILKNSDHPFVLGLNSTEIEWEKIDQYLNFQKLNVDDFVYIQAGLVHAIPKETMVFELQQSSDITYRIYDYDRVDKNGLKRQLHIEESKKVVKPNTKTDIVKNKNQLVKNKYFNLNKKVIDKEIDFKINEDFYWVEFSNIDGEIFIDGLRIPKYHSAILSGKFKDVKISGKGIILYNIISK